MPKQASIQKTWVSENRNVFSSGYDSCLTPNSNYDAFKVRANMTTKNWGAGFN